MRSWRTWNLARSARWRPSGVWRTPSPQSGTGGDAADAAAAEWTRVFSRRDQPAEIPELPIDFGAAESLEVGLATLIADAGAADSRARAKRLLRDGAVQLNGERITGTSASLRDGDVLKIGRRRWLRIARQ